VSNVASRREALTPRNSSAGISVVICCYNSAGRIEATLDRLAAQSFSGDFEIVLVDNNCTDNTAAVAQSHLHSKHSRLPLQVVLERCAGLSHARMAGLRSARFEYLIFCDDDNWLAPDYLSLACSILDQNPQVGVVGGQSQAAADTRLPDWFIEEAPNYAVGTQGQCSGDVNSRLFVWGAGMVLRRSVLLHLVNGGIETHLTDRAGSSLASGGDGEICAWFRIAGFQIGYDERLRFQHFVPAERLTREYVDRLKAGFQQAEGLVLAYRELLFGWRPSTFKERLGELLTSLVQYFRMHTPASCRRLQRLLPIPGIVIDSNMYIAIKTRRKIRRLMATFHHAKTSR